MKIISILRGINVGGKRKLLMADLKTIATNCGAQNVDTYIQSGNILADWSGSKKEFSQKLSASIQSEFGYEVPVITISSEDLAIAAAKNPFANSSDITQMHLTFLSEEADQKIIDNLRFPVSEDEFHIKGNFVYIKCKGSYHKTKLSNQFFEKNLQVQATTRNWKTVSKLLELSMKS